MQKRERHLSHDKRCVVLVSIVLWLGAVGVHPVSAVAQVRLGQVVHVSADRPDVPHAESHLAIHPSDPSLMLAGAIVMPDGEPSVVEILYSADGGPQPLRSPSYGRPAPQDEEESPIKGTGTVM